MINDCTHTIFVHSSVYRRSSAIEIYVDLSHVYTCFNLRRENLSTRALASAQIDPKDILLKCTLAIVPIQLRLGVLGLCVPKPKQNGNRQNT